MMNLSSESRGVDMLMETVSIYTISNRTWYIQSIDSTRNNSTKKENDYTLIL